MTIWIADRHPFFRHGLASLLQEHWPTACVGQLDSMDELEAGLPCSAGIRLLLLDMALPGLQGLPGLANLAARHPDIHVIAMCDDTPDSLNRLLAHGAMGGIIKSAPPPRFTDAVDAVLHGRCWLPDGTLDHPFCELHDAQSGVTHRMARLTPRRLLILSMVADGLLNKQIAHELGLCESTIKAHISEIMKIMRVRNRTQIATAVTRLRDSASNRPPFNPNVRYDDAQALRPQANIQLLQSAQ